MRRSRKYFLFIICYWGVQNSAKYSGTLSRRDLQLLVGKYDSCLMQHLKVIVHALISCPTRDLQNRFMRLTVIFSLITNFVNVAAEGQCLSSSKSWPWSPHVPCVSSLPHHMDPMTTDNEHFKKFIHTMVEAGKHVVLEMGSEIRCCDPHPMVGWVVHPQDLCPPRTPQCDLDWK